MQAQWHCLIELQKTFYDQSIKYLGRFNAFRNCMNKTRIAEYFLHISSKGWGAIVSELNVFAWNTIDLKTMTEPEMSFILIKSLVVIIKRSFHSPAFSQMCRSIIQLRTHKNIWTFFLQNISILFAKYFKFICQIFPFFPQNISSFFAKIVLRGSLDCW